MRLVAFPPPSSVGEDSPDETSQKTKQDQGPVAVAGPDPGQTHSPESLAILCEEIDLFLAKERTRESVGEIASELVPLCRRAGIEQGGNDDPVGLIVKLKDRRYDLGLDLEKLAPPIAEAPAEATEEKAGETIGEETPVVVARQESETEVLARVVARWEGENARLENRIALVSVDILRLGDRIKGLKNECKELTEELDARLSAGPPTAIPQLQKALPFDGEAKQAETETAEQAAEESESPEPLLIWEQGDQQEGETYFVADSEVRREDGIRAQWAIYQEEPAEDGAERWSLHESDAELSPPAESIVFESLDLAQAEAESLERKLREVKAPASPAPADEDGWQNVRLDKWPKPHCLAPGTLKLLIEAGLETVGQVSDWTQSGKRLTEIRGFGEGKLEKFEQAETAFWARWKRDPAKVLSEEV